MQPFFKAIIKIFAQVRRYVLPFGCDRPAAEVGPLSGDDRGRIGGEKRTDGVCGKPIKKDIRLCRNAKNGEPASRRWVRGAETSDFPRFPADLA